MNANNLVIKILIMTLTIAAIGYYTNGLVMNNLRLRRRANVKRQEQMIVVANYNYGKLGIWSGLVV